MRRSVALALSAALLGAVAGPATAAPIPEGPDAASLPPFIGAKAQSQPVFSPDPPRHPFMAPNGRSNLHVDAFQTDVHQAPGPLGDGTSRTSSFHGGVCASVTFDSAGRIETVCVGATGPTLRLLDPRTLETIASLALPPRQPGAPSGSIFTDFAGGGYFYLDERDRAVIPTTTRHIQIVRQTPGPGLAVEKDLDLTSAVRDGDKIISALPDWSGRLWFASTNGVVGTADERTGAVRPLDLREPIANSIAIDDTGGVYVVTDGALYRLDATADGTPAVTWREPYENQGVQKPGQAAASSGTTPTLMGSDLVAITDNADPMRIVVLKRAKQVAGTRLVCTQPVFSRGASATDQSLIGTEDALVVENNHGYSGPTATQNGGTTAPGLERVDVDRASGRCTTAWRSTERAPSVVPKLSASTGLVYTYTKEPRSDGADAWYLTAIDFRTGATRFKALAGEGLGHNNNYAPVTLADDGTAYVGTLGGIVALRDRVPPPRLVAERPARQQPAARAPRLRLVLRRARGGALRARVLGADRRLVRRVWFAFRGRPLGRADRRAPFAVTVSRSRRPRSGVRRLRAVATLRDGSRVRLQARVRRAPRRGPR